YQYEIIEQATPLSCAPIEEVNQIENMYYQIRVEDGSLRLHRHSDQTNWQDFLIFRHQLDAGDSYNYSAPLMNTIQYAHLIKSSAWRQGSQQQLVLDYELTAPAAIHQNRQSPSQAWHTMPITVKISLDDKHEDMVISFDFDQKFKDAKIQVGCLIGNETHVYADTAFELVERKLQPITLEKAAIQKETSWTQFPSLRNVYQPELNLQLTHDGLTECELTQTAHGNYIWLTAVRAVGWLSRRDLNSRGGGAGPGYETPEAQCQRQYTCQVMLSLEAKNYQANRYQRLLPVVLAQGAHAIPEQHVCEIDNSHIHVTRTKQNTDGTYSIRLANPTLQEQVCRLRCGEHNEIYRIAPKKYMTVQI
ncbi:MAG: hypothetical protein ACRC3A_01965, partial [Culicoidibacterales bacterium]